MPIVKSITFCFQSFASGAPTIAVSPSWPYQELTPGVMDHLRLTRMS